MKYRLAVINGKFCSQTTTGVQRYAREIVAELDRQVPDDLKIVLAVNKDAANVPELKNIETVRVGRLSGSLWEQISLPRYVRKHKALCVSLCNMTPILTPHIVAVHDVSYKVNKRFFSRKFSAWYNFVFGLTMRRIKEIITVSEFSRSEIKRVYKRDLKNITVTYNGRQHFERIKSDESALDKYGLTDGEYYFSMSSMAANKNFRWTAAAAANNPKSVFAVSGAVNEKVFGDVLDFEIPKNLKMLGYVSDEEAKALMSHCKAFLFPTFYEGFGIPPLEALSAGAKAAVSDASCMREIFGDCVYYVDPNDPNVELDELLSGSVSAPDGLFERYDWEKSAHKVLTLIRKYVKTEDKT